MTKKEAVKINVKERLDDNTLDLSLSELTEVPVKEIALLKRATILDLSSNQISTLGNNFITLTQLTQLDLSKNQLKFLPDNFGNLVNLRHLDLYNNELEHVPLSVGNLKQLRYLDMKRNPLTPIIGKVVGQCLTTKDCQESAKRTVKFLAQMQVQQAKEREKVRIEKEAAEALQKQQALEEEKVKEAKRVKNKKKRDKAKKKEAEAAALEAKEQTPSLKESNSTSTESSNKESSVLWRIALWFNSIILLYPIFVLFVLMRPAQIQLWIESVPAPFSNILQHQVEMIDRLGNHAMKVLSKYYD